MERDGEVRQDGGECGLRRNKSGGGIRSGYGCGPLSLSIGKRKNTGGCRRDVPGKLNRGVGFGGPGWGESLAGTPSGDDGGVSYGVFWHPLVATCMVEMN